MIKKFDTQYKRIYAESDNCYVVCNMYNNKLGYSKYTINLDKTCKVAQYL